MFTVLLLDGALKIVQIIRYRNKRATARIWDPRATTPEAVFTESRHGSNIFVDSITNKKYRNYPSGMVAL